LIALIEDDPLIRVPIAYALQAAGFDVVAAASGAEGLTLLEDRQIDVAVIDVVLPGRISGVAMVKEARRLNPTLRVIFTSGLPLPEDAAGIGLFLPKPFRIAELVDMLRDAIGGASPPPASAADPSVSQPS
jgi:DNA-binding response OmpR family regulator